jgi:hypothetical protein
MHHMNILDIATTLHPQDDRQVNIKEIAYIQRMAASSHSTVHRTLGQKPRTLKNT